MQFKPNKFTQIGIAALLVTTLYASEEIADYRHESMEAIGVHWDTIRKIARGELPFEEHLPKHVDALADLAEMMADLFPEGSEGGEALDSIWEEPEEFKKAVEAFNTAAKELQRVISEGETDSVSDAIRNVGRSCKGCHDSYRE